MDAMENLSRLKDVGVVQRVTQDAATQFCEDFEVVEDKILATDEAISESRAGELGQEAGQETQGGSWTPLRELFPRTAAEIRVLLS